MDLDKIVNCTYISSVGLLKACDENNIITYHKDPSQIIHDYSKLGNGKEGCCIYIKFAFIREFVYQILEQIPFKFILITGDGDETMPYNIFNMETFQSIVNHDKIIHWYSVNCIEALHPKFSLIPIGVNFHSSTFGGNEWHDRAISPVEQENMMISIRDSAKPFYERELLCYSNFHFNTYREFGNPREKALVQIPKELVVYEQQYVERVYTWENQCKTAFVISPLGHGMDCHRTWEALILGCIVIVQKSPLDSLYEDLPVLIVDEWSDITESLLKDTVDRFKTLSFNYDKITLQYWVNKIRSTRIA